MSSACPLCEHVQPDGDVCDVCGRPLGRPADAVAPEPPLDGLEPTALGDPGTPAIMPLEGLEPTFLAAGEPSRLERAPLEMLPGLEPTRAPPAEVEVAPIAELEPTAVGVPDDAPTPLPAVATCRYCRTPALPGERRCGRCGMRLPVIEARRGVRASAPEDVRLCSCGSPVSGALCPTCGARIPSSLEG